MMIDLPETAKPAAGAERAPWVAPAVSKVQAGDAEAGNGVASENALGS